MSEETEDIALKFGKYAVAEVAGEGGPAAFERVADVIVARGRPGERDETAAERACNTGEGKAILTVGIVSDHHACQRATQPRPEFYGAIMTGFIFTTDVEWRKRAGIFMQQRADQRRCRYFWSCLAHSGFRTALQSHVRACGHSGGVWRNSATSPRKQRL